MKPMPIWFVSGNSCESVVKSDDFHKYIRNVVNKMSVSLPWGQCVNSSSPERCGCGWNCVIFTNITREFILRIQTDNALEWMPRDLTERCVVQVMAWCRHATSFYLKQCWPRFPTPYGVTMLIHLSNSALLAIVRFHVTFFGHDDSWRVRLTGHNPCNEWRIHVN